MRAGVAVHDYKEETPNLAALIVAVELWTMTDKKAGFAYALGQGSGQAAAAASASMSASSSPAPQKESKESKKALTAESAQAAVVMSAAESELRRSATDGVNRMKKAYTMIHSALRDELRRLVNHIPQGDAYGLWMWLEKKFQNTESDNVGRLWDEFTSLSQQEDESFDDYKSRVDHLFGLLEHAKDKPSQGQYAHRLLWKLAPRFNAAVLALKVGGQLKDAANINWAEIVETINSYERGQTQLDNEQSGSETVNMMKSATYRRDDRKNDTCYNCDRKGHHARDCPKPRRARDNRQDTNENGRDGAYGAGATRRETIENPDGRGNQDTRRNAKEMRREDWSEPERHRVNAVLEADPELESSITERVIARPMQTAKCYRLGGAMRPRTAAGRSRR